MHVLVATSRTQGERPGDFDWCVPGELVQPGEVCGKDRDDPDGGCGCARSWVGLASGKSTTSAAVADLEMTRDDYQRAHLDAVLADWPMDADERVVLERSVDNLLDLATAYPVGAVLGRQLDSVVERGGV